MGYKAIDLLLVLCYRLAHTPEKLLKQLYNVGKRLFRGLALRNTIEAYLDIETTGLSSTYCIVTVIGIYICNGEDAEVIQLVGKDITADSLLETLEGVKIIHTYNGSRFDLPFIYACIGVDLNQIFPHRDLMFDCWKNNLYGGLKAVERQLGIERRLKDMNGWEAIKLWWKYVDSFDLEALNKLLEYNREDVVNLKTLKAKLGILTY